MRWSIAMCVLVLGAGSVLAGPIEVSPFEMVRWEKGEPQVRVDGRWFELIKLNGLTRAEVIDACRKLDRERWQKRFCEDLVAALATVGKRLGQRDELVLRDVKSGKSVTRKVTSTRANREAIRRAKVWKRIGRQPEAAVTVQRVKRPHVDRIDPRFAHFVLRHFDDDDGPRVTGEQATADLDQLEWMIENEYSYRDRVSFDYRAALDTVRTGLADSIAVRDFMLQTRKVVARFGDGHARVRGIWRALPRGYLPCAVESDDHGVAALTDTGGLFDTKRPYLLAIDGVPLEKWIAVAGRVHAAGSPQFVLSQSLDTLVFVRFLRKEMSLPDGDTVALTLAARGGGDKVTVKREVAGRPPRWARPRLAPRPRRLPGDIGYIPIPDMSVRGGAARTLARAVTTMADTRGLILDVRGNSGGVRDILREMLPYFLAPDEPAFVANVAAYRLPPGATRETTDGYLSNRYCFPASSSSFSDAQRAAAQRAAAAFKPSRKLDPTLFSSWHFMVLERTSAHGTFHYNKPVVVLIDERCFSATDIFVGAFATRQNVTLMGAATGGGSGRAQQFELVFSRLRVKLSTMASFRPDGRLYDGVGIAPTKPAPPRDVMDRIRGRDRVLEEAVKHLSKP